MFPRGKFSCERYNSWRRRREQTPLNHRCRQQLSTLDISEFEARVEERPQQVKRYLWRHACRGTPGRLHVAMRVLGFRADVNHGPVPVSNAQHCYDTT